MNLKIVSCSVFLVSRERRIGILYVVGGSGFTNDGHSRIISA